jgi:dipeptidyl-peptidase-4
MKNRLILCLVVSVLQVSLLWAQKEITLEDIWTKGTFSARGVAGFNSLIDGRYYCNLDEKQNLLRFEFATGKLVDTLVSNKEIKQANGGEAIDMYNYSWSDDESRLLIATQTEAIFRHSSQSLFYVYELASKKLVQPVKEKIRYATLAPDNSKMAYVKNNDLYYYDFRTQSEMRVTKDGKENAVINGATDWVYEEEFAIWQGFSWSPNSDKIAFYRFDESRVPEFEMTLYGSLYPKQNKFKYPKAGEVNSLVNIFVFDTINIL